MAETTLSKVCSKCNIEKLISEFGKAKQNKDGLNRACKQCRAVYNREYYKNNKENISNWGRDYYRLNKKKMGEYNKEYRRDNKDSLKVKSDDYYELNREKILKQKQEYYAKNVVDIKKGQNDYRKKNRLRLAHRARGYRQTEAGRISAKAGGAKYRARKAGAKVESFNPVTVFERDGYVCQLCGVKTRPYYKNCYHPLYPTLDHIIPLSKGGDHSKRNAQCLCRQCNIKKSYVGVGDQLRLFG
jgi:hypothetical protein